MATFTVTARKGSEEISFVIAAHNADEALQLAEMQHMDEIRTRLGDGNFLWEIEGDFVF